MSAEENALKKQIQELLGFADEDEPDKFIEIVSDYDYTENHQWMLLLLISEDASIDGKDVKALKEKLGFDLDVIATSDWLKSWYCYDPKKPFYGAIGFKRQLPRELSDDTRKSLQ